MNDEIERKILMEPDKKHPFLLALGLVVAVWAFGTMAEGAGFFVLGALFALPMLLLVSLLAGWIMGTTASKEISQRAHQAMMEFIGTQPKYLDVLCVGSKKRRGALVGTAIAITDQHLYVMDDGEVGRIPFSQVRNGTWKIAGYTALSGSGIPSNMKASMQNIENRATAALDSGFFVQVRDVSKPVWQFMATDQEVLQRWMEIFRQTFESTAQR
jgi:hypothetical protein